ncbi:MAG: signal peptidase I [Verrucomicrobiales bacterium]|nr:signal peptidase I [Verrucomicrobiales bacterium]
MKRLLLVGAGILGAALLFHARFSLVLSVGESMRPTLGNRELLLVDRRAYRSAGPGRSEVVVARHFGELIIKRVVGLPGETVEVQEGRLQVEGVPVVEGYPLLAGRLRISRGRLGEDRYALLGDNRSLERSQIVQAVVARDQILGKVVASLPFADFGRFLRTGE